MRDEIFISYSHQDGKYLTELRESLAPLMEGKGSITVWDDQAIESGSLWRTEIDAALERTRVAILLVTTKYLASRFVSQSELPTILEEAAKGKLRIVWVAVSASAYDKTELAKYQAANDPRKPLDLMSVSKRRAAWVNIAEKICDCHQNDEPAMLQSSRETTAPARHHGKPVLVAQTTDDVADEADQLRSYLGQFADEILVLPTTTYPQGGEPFRAAFENDLAQAKLFVQLLGRRVGRRPPDLPEGYTCWQLERAKAAGIEIMQWRHPEIDTKTMEDASYKEILSAETVVASGLEAFKRQILNWARKPPPKPVTPRSSTVFINADERDLGIAKDVERECVNRALTAILPMTGPASEAIREDLAENLIDCDMLVFIYGDTTQAWMRSQLRFFNKIKPKRESDPRLLAICCGPPRKPDIGMSFPGAHVVECHDGWNLEAIRMLITEYAK